MPSTFIPVYDRMEDIEPIGATPSPLEFEPSWSLKISPDEFDKPNMPTSDLLPAEEFISIPQEDGDDESDDPDMEELVQQYSKGLSSEQRNVLQVVAEGKSIFFTGAAGTGKSATLKSVISMLKRKYKRKRKYLAITASTGLAALHIHGETLHSFAGVGLGKKPIDELLMGLSKKTLKKWRKVKTLIIDEISMIDGAFFDKLEKIAVYAKASSTGEVHPEEHPKGRGPFGGIQLVICGDFFQLPPVPDYDNGVSLPIRFAFEADSWNRSVPLQVRLTKVFRQDDPGFIGILNKMRIGEADATLEWILSHLERDVACDGLEPLHIYPRNFQVENENISRLDALPGNVFEYEAEDEGRWLEHEDDYAHYRRITYLLDKHSAAPRSLVLKEDAQVMLTKNLVPRSLINGSLGRIVGFASYKDAHTQDSTTVLDILLQYLPGKYQSFSRDEIRRMLRLPMISPDSQWPVVQFSNGQRVLFTPLPFDMEDAYGHLLAKRAQVPLILAWAISVHKSQGKTIERLKIDFEGTFEDGQAYVAMSRSTGMETLQIINFKASLVKANPRVVRWYKNLLIESEMDTDEAIASYFSRI